MPLSTINSNSFSTTANTNIDNGNLFIDAINNRIGMGTTTPVATHHIKGSGTSGQTTSALILENASSGTLGLDITGTAGSSYARLRYGGGPGTGTNSMTGDVALIGLEGSSIGFQQIKFAPTQVASSDANTLDDYEEGTWTPNFQNNGSTSNWTTKSGRYIKIGSLVYISFNNSGGGSSNGGSGSGAIILNNLPFNMTYGNTLDNNQAIRVAGGSNGTTALDWLTSAGGQGNGAQVTYNAAGNQEQGNLTSVSGFWVYITSQ